MKTILHLIAAMICCFPAIAQQTSFIRDFQDDVNNIVPATDSTFYIISRHPVCGKNYLTIRYHNRRGDLLRGFSTKTYPGVINNVSATVDAAQNIYTVFTTANFTDIIKSDTSGQNYWTYYFSNAYPITYNKILTTGSAIYLTGISTAGTGTDSVRGIITALDMTGSLQWTKIWKAGNGFKQTYLTDCRLYGGQLWFSGWYSNGAVGGVNLTYPFIAQSDMSGNPLSAKIYVIDSFINHFDDYKPTGFEKNAAGEMYLIMQRLGTQTAIMKLDASLNPLWVKRSSGSINAFCTPAAGDGLVLAYESQANSNLFFVDGTCAVTSKTASTQATLKYNDVTSIARFDGGYLAGKYAFAHILASDKKYCADTPLNAPLTFFTVANPTVRSATFNTYARQLTQYLTVENFTDTVTLFNTKICDKTTTNLAIASPTGENAPQVVLYPQPADDRLFVRVNNAAAQEPLEILSTDGRVVMRVMNSGAGLNVSSLTPGVYYVRQGVAVAKFLKR